MMIVITFALVLNILGKIYLNSFYPKKCIVTSLCSPNPIRGEIFTQPRFSFASSNEGLTQRTSCSEFQDVSLTAFMNLLYET